MYFNKLKICLLALEQFERVSYVEPDGARPLCVRACVTEPRRRGQLPH